MPHKEDDEDESDHVVVVDAKDSSDAAEAISRIIVSHAEAVHNDGALELWQEIAPIIARLQPRDPGQSARPQGASAFVHSGSSRTASCDDWRGRGRTDTSTHS